MKKIFILTFSLAASAFTFQSCTAPVDNSKAFAAIDSLSTVKMMAFGDSLKMACMNDAMASAKLMTDSMMNAAMSSSKTASKKAAPKATPAAPSNAKSDKMSGASTTATQDKKDKMDNTTQSTTEKKKDKMSKGTDPNPKF